MNQCTKPIQKLSKEVKSDNLWYREVRREITKWGTIEKRPILLLQHCKIWHFGRASINSYIRGINNIFADCIILSPHHITNTQWKSYTHTQNNTHSLLNTLNKFLLCIKQNMCTFWAQIIGNAFFSCKNGWFLERLFLCFYYTRQEKRFKRNTK